MIIARKIAYNVLVSSIAKVLATVLALISIGLITRYLGKEGFGNYATVLAFFSFFGALGDLGLYSVSTREISRPGADEEKIMSNIFTLRLCSSLLILAGAPIVVIFFPYPKEVKEAIVIIAASFLFSSAYQVLNGVFQKNLAMDRVALSELAGKALQVILIYAAIRLNLGFSWVVSSLLFYMVLSFSLVFFWSRRYVRIQLKFDFSYWKTFLKESYPLGISALITFAYFKLDTIILSIVKSSADVGIYSAAYKVIENITFFPSMLVGLIFPIISQNIISDFEKFKDIANKTFKVFLVLVVPLVIGTLFLSEGVIQLIGGAGFAESANVLRILIFALAFIFFSNLLNAILISASLQKKLMVILGMAAFLNIVSNFIFIPRFSYLGAASVSVFTELFVSLAALFLTVKYVKYWPSAENVWGIFLSGAAMAIALFLTSFLNFFARGLVGVFVYFVFLWIFRAVRTEEITSIVSKKDDRTAAIDQAPLV